MRLGILQAWASLRKQRLRKQSKQRKSAGSRSSQRGIAAVHVHQLRTCASECS